MPLVKLVFFPPQAPLLFRVAGCRGLSFRPYSHSWASGCGCRSTAELPPSECRCRCSPHPAPLSPRWANRAPAAACYLARKSRAASRIRPSRVGSDRVGPGWVGSGWRTKSAASPGNSSNSSSDGMSHATHPLLGARGSTRRLAGTRRHPKVPAGEGAELGNNSLGYCNCVG